ncbi:MAG TPA: hypothetical protein VFQ76_12200, partial [Longimicrobiaceae bacterium]|nr:hypothetical protein [Longimicrobiaceae bacterium]
MLVVLSDLHFLAEQHEIIPGNPPIGRRRNLPSAVFVQFVRRLAEEAVNNGKGRKKLDKDGKPQPGPEQLDLVLSGDIFEVTRSMIWCDYKCPPMPYEDPPTPGSELERRVLEVLNAIASIDIVDKEAARREKLGDDAIGEDAIDDPSGAAASLRVFRRLAAGKYLIKNGSVVDFPADKVVVHYLTGNHDRACNATPEIRRWVRRTLGLGEGGEPFPNQIPFKEAAALVRHGHEYDPRAFGADYTNVARLPEPIPAEAYRENGLGDFVTVEIASRLPWEFRQIHGVEKIREVPLLRNVYERLLEFDDVRPQSHLLDFLLTDPDIVGKEREAWDLIEPLLRRVLTRLASDPWMHRWLVRRRMWVALLLLRLRLWRITRRIPSSLVRRLLSAGKEPPPPVAFAAKEPALHRKRDDPQGYARYVIAGHTHNPAVELAVPDGDGGRYYVDTGTWRNRIPVAPNTVGFGRLKALTYVIVYGP